MGRLLAAVIASVFTFGPAAAHQAHHDGEVPRIVDLADLPLKNQIETVGYCKGRFSVTTRDGLVHDFADFNLLLKIDSGKYGPNPGSPVLVPLDATKERGFVIFSQVDEITIFLKSHC